MFKRWYLNQLKINKDVEAFHHLTVLVLNHSE